MLIGFSRLSEHEPSSDLDAQRRFLTAAGVERFGAPRRLETAPRASISVARAIASSSPVQIGLRAVLASSSGSPTR